MNLFPELLDGAEYLLMFIEEVEKLFEHLGDIFVNPVLVLEFDYDAVSIDICKVLLANFDLFQAIEKHQHDPHDFLRVEIIEDLADLFDDSSVVILKILLAVLVETQYPEHGHDVVGDLWLAEARSLEQFANHVEAGAVDEYFGEIIALQKSHESKGVGVDRDAKLIDITLDNNPVKELFRTLFNFLELRLLSVPTIWKWNIRNKNMMTNTTYTVRSAKRWEAMSLCTLSSISFLCKKLFKTAITLTGFLKWFIKAKNVLILVLLSSKMPSRWAKQ